MKTIIKKMKIHQFFFQKLSKAFERRYQTQGRGRRGQEPNLMIVNHALNELFFVEKLRTYCAAMSYQIFTHQNLGRYPIENFLFVPEIIKVVKYDTTNQWHPIIEIYVYLIEWFQKFQTKSILFPPVLTDLNKLERMIYEQNKHLTTEEQIEIYSYITNCMTALVNAGNQQLITNYIEYHQKIIALQHQSQK